MTDFIVPPQGPGSSASSIDYRLTQSDAIQYVELVQPPLVAGVLRRLFDTVNVGTRLGVHFINHDARLPVMFVGTVTTLAIDGFELLLDDDRTNKMYIRIDAVAYWRIIF